ncbi:MAG: hypothetical protein FWG51_06165, partial [Firmicutes bacterium]|nr:hypothetical protein [Bacillota bacterium]
ENLKENSSTYTVLRYKNAIQSIFANAHHVQFTVSVMYYRYNPDASSSAVASLCRGISHLNFCDRRSCV